MQDLTSAADQDPNILSLEEYKFVDSSNSTLEGKEGAAFTILSARGGKPTALKNPFGKV